MTATLTPADLASRLGKSPDYWLREARAKRVPHRRIGRDIRFTEDDVDAILSASFVKAVDPLRDEAAPGSRKRGGAR